MVSVPFRVSRPALTLIVVDCPAASVPEEGDTVRFPTRPEDSPMDQLTGPPVAFSVKLPAPPRLSARLLGDTLSVPAGGGALLVFVAGADEFVPPPADPVAGVVLLPLPGPADDPPEPLSPEPDPAPPEPEPPDPDPPDPDRPEPDPPEPDRPDPDPPAPEPPDPDPPDPDPPAPEPLPAADPAPPPASQ